MTCSSFGTGVSQSSQLKYVSIPLASHTLHFQEDFKTFYDENLPTITFK